MAQYFLNNFWKRWLREYLPLILPRPKWTKKEQPLQIRDLVLIVDKQSPRNVWRKGLIEHTFVSSDGQGRVAKVRIANGTILRAVHYLVKLNS